LSGWLWANRMAAPANADPRFGGVFTLFRANVPKLFLDLDRTNFVAIVAPPPPETVPVGEQLTRL
jgi:hypothetical protein